MELLHVVKGDNNEEGLTIVDNWKATDAMYLEDMGFKNDGMYSYALKKPEMRVKHKKGVGFILHDYDKNEEKTFPKFKDLEEYFAKYQQKWENQPYL